MEINVYEYNDESSDKLSRGEVETLCVLAAIGRGGCDVREVAERLGLSPTLAEVIAGGLEPLVAAGLLLRERRFVEVTEEGHRMLSSRLEALGLG
jgi:DNA-binding MarR family transcriptional regulator